MASEFGSLHQGFHNRNYVLRVPDPQARRLGVRAGEAVVVRIPMADALPVVIRTWSDEGAVLAAIQGVLPHVPRCLVRQDGYAIHSYAEGVPLSSVCGNGKPVDRLLIGALTDLLAQMTRVRRAALPSLSAVWPVGGSDSRSFLRTLALLADRQIRQSNWPVFGGLFAALGVPDDALVRLAERVPTMARRPYSLLHADLHRDNVIMSYSGDPPLICVDWELATYGDPLHDLATHLVRMRYPSHQWDEVIESWARAMHGVRPEAAGGVAEDLRHYVDFERAQSVYPDVMRAAQSLEGPFDQRDLDNATRAVRAALEAATEPLGLRNVANEAQVERLLLQWRFPASPAAVRRGAQGWSTPASPIRCSGRLASAFPAMGRHSAADLSA